MANGAFRGIADLIIGCMEWQPSFGEQIWKQIVLDGPMVTVRVEAALGVYELFPLVDNSMCDEGGHAREQLGDKRLVVAVRPFPEALFYIGGELRSKARQLRILVAQEACESRARGGTHCRVASAELLLRVVRT